MTFIELFWGTYTFIRKQRADKRCRQERGRWGQWTLSKTVSSMTDFWGQPQQKTLKYYKLSEKWKKNNKDNPYDKPRHLFGEGGGRRRWILMTKRTKNVWNSLKLQLLIQIFKKYSRGEGKPYSMGEGLKKRSANGFYHPHHIDYRCREPPPQSWPRCAYRGIFTNLMRKKRTYI